MNHILSGKHVYDIKLNGNCIGELGINALIAGHFGVPVLLVTGDDKTCLEAIELLREVETVSVKESIDRYVARCLTPSVTSKLIQETVIRALENINQFQALKIESQLKGEIIFKTTSKATSATMIPTVKRTDSRTVSFTCKNILEFYSLIQLSLIMAGRDEIA
ncbi:MAG: M55 family metallopeptidase [Promethearchaeota archaeon]